MKILYITTVGSTMGFFYEHFRMLIENGCEIELACGNAKPIRENVATLGLPTHTISFSRTPFSKDNLKAYKQLKAVIEKGNYDIVHCHTPNASAITRLVCRKFRKKNGLKVFYTAHGFHFYKGAPLKNWLFYYPVEKFCSYFTDKLITINQEDFALAKKKMRAKDVLYVPGVGVDLSKFENVQVDRMAKRKEIGVPEDAFLLISVGELSVRKNHKVVIDALAQMECKNIYYAIAGEGILLDELKDRAKTNGVFDKVFFLGYRKDITELYKAADLCCLPSIHEGLPVAVMEAMACGLPCVVSKIRGNVDLIDTDGGFISEFDNVKGFADAIAIMNSKSDLRKSMGEYNNQRSHMYDINIIVQKMKEVYEIG